ncbi:hypothetical protein JTB14_023445 [Gonioctena quinquepunctata]|nr:hypothetical protein JTB14_023445 [Gonioctena quinquepunctata]
MSKTCQSEHLIECVRKHTVLYDTSSKAYSDAHLKFKLWEQIAKECGFLTGKEAKNAWKNLRDGYRCSLKTAKSTKSGDTAKKTKPWKFSEQMNFLIPYMKDRPRSSNISGDGESTSPLNETQHEVHDEPENVHENSSDNDDDDEHVLQLTGTPSTSSARHLTKKISQQQTNERAPAKKKKLVGSEDQTLEFLKGQARKREERSEINVLGTHYCNQ